MHRTSGPEGKVQTTIAAVAAKAAGIGTRDIPGVSAPGGGAERTRGAPWARLIFSGHQCGDVSLIAE